MRSWLGHRSNKSGFSVDADPAMDVFEQPERSLLSEAFGRPLGIVALVLFFLALGALAVNHFMLAMDKINDYAMVALFLSGGLLLSILLRSGEPRTARAKSRRQQAESDSPDLLIEQEEDLSKSDTTGHQRRGLEEAPSSGAPIPAAATAETLHSMDIEQDDEVAGYERALLHYAERGDLHGQGEILRRLGHTAKARGHLGESREFYVNSRNCFKETNDHYAEAAVLLDLGQVLESLGDHDAASAAYRDANRALLDVAMNSTNQSGITNAQAAD